MSKLAKNIIQFVVFIAFGVLLFWLVYKDTNWRELFNGIKQVNYCWFILIAIIGIISHISRAIRWNLLIRPMGYETRFWNTFFAVMVGYFANLAVPRLGEVARCGVVSKYDKVPLSKVLGTMITERVIDMITMPLFIVVALLAGSGLIQDFLSTNQDVSAKMSSIFNITNLLIFVFIIAIGIILFYLLLKGKFDRIPFFEKIKNFARNLYDGLMSIRQVKKKFWFIFHSLLIWVCYYLMVVVSMPAFGFTQDLGFMAALIVFIAGSFGMIAPAPNGIGAYHFMVIQALLLFGIFREDAALYAFLIHTFQTLLLLLAGLFSLFMLPIINRIPKAETNPIANNE
ncbi:MAG: flippase-like domain-containing protein [Bacteroidales bacterium]|nr:flippase-like domain-containing protein [Bacteroidales bacterium]